MALEEKASRAGPKQSGVSDRAQYVTAMSAFLAAIACLSIFVEFRLLG